MTFDWTTIVSLLGHFWAIVARLTGMMLAAPIFNTKLIPARLKIVFLVLLTGVLMTVVPMVMLADIFSYEGLRLVGRETCCGVMIGLTFSLCLHIFIIVGQMASMQMGLSFAVMNDPVNNLSTTTISQFYLLLVTLLFLSLDGHLAMIKFLYESYRVFPIDTPIQLFDILAFVKLGGWMFAQALQVVLPLIVSLLIVNITFAVLTKAAPQINIFSIGFPITMLLGLLFLWIHLAGVAVHLPSLMTTTFEILQHLLTVDSGGA